MVRNLLICIFALFSYGASAQVVINEVMTDPAGSDTGQEWIEIYNAGSEAIDLSGWQLYPDGVGYYTVPSGFHITGNSFVTIHLRTSGEDSGADLYHANATGNMGNSAGSVALFLPGERGEDTIKSFFRYQKPGSSERKTWESAAVEAGLWQAGAFLDTSNVSEGNSLGLASDGVTSGFHAAWRLFTSATEGLSNIATALLPEASSPAEPTSFATVPILAMPRLEVAIASQQTAVVGAPHRFEARAFDEGGKAIADGVRHLWNFGDGEVAEGRTVLHTFRFPGEYRVSVNVTTGAALGTAFSDIRALPNAVRLSEVLPGENGFIEILNGSDEVIDVGGWIVEESLTQRFTVPVGTKLKSSGFFVLANVTSGLLLGTSSPAIVLRYANEEEVDRVSLANIPAGESTARAGDQWVAGFPTPGSGPVTGSAKVQKEKEPDRAEPPSVEVVESSVDLVNTASAAGAYAPLAESLPGEAGETSGEEHRRGGGMWLYAAAGLAAILGGAGVVVIRRKLT